MAKSQSPLLGYNNNVRHRGRVFHIQTEDSGVARPHVITHLFADGGRILKTSKTSYTEHLAAPDLPAFVKKLMQDQHKAMFIALRDGQFDALLEVPAEAPAPQTLEVATPLPGSVDVTADRVTASLEDDRSTMPPSEGVEIAEVEFAPVTVPVAPPPRSVLQPVRATLLRAASTSSQEASVPREDLAATPTASQPPPLPRVTQPPPLPTAVRATVGPGRAVTPRSPSGATPAARVREAPPSIFAESLVGERSLDEVILAYLAEELGGTPRT